MPYHTDLYLSRIPYEPEPTFPTQPAEKYAVGPGWMSFRPYSGGELPNWGCHGLSMVQWALEMDNSGPVEIWVDPAEKMETVVYDTPETRDRGDAACSKSIINYKYANGVVLTLSSIDPRVGGGATFIGDKGRITIFRGGYECDPKGLDEDPLPADAIRVYESDNHMQNFYDCVRLAQRPDHECRERASRGHLVPSGQHRPLARTPAEVGPGEGDLPRRRRSQHVSRRSETQRLRTARAGLALEHESLTEWDVGGLPSGGAAGRIAIRPARRHLVWRSIAADRPQP